MKRKHFANRLLSHSTIWVGCAAVICTISLQSTATAGETPAAPAPEPKVGENWIDFTIGNVANYGDEAAFQSRFARNGDFFGGISDMGWKTDLNDSTTLSLTGHALTGLEDYGFTAKIEKQDLGYLEVGYKQFETWYDNTGGYVPGTNNWMPIWNDEFSVERGQVWLETGLRMENLPEITFRYSHAWRDGTKDSTAWGTASSVSLPVIPAATNSFKSTPSLTLIDETTDIFRLDVNHTIGNTYFGGGLSYEKINNQDTRVMRNSATPANATAGTIVQDTASYESDIFNGHLFSETRLGEKLMFSFGYSYTNFDTDIGGDRPSNSASTGDLLTGSDHALWGITGGSQGSINVLNANLWWNPTKDLTIVPSVRAEFWDNGGWANHVGGIRGSNVTPTNTADQVVEDAIGGLYPGLGPNYGLLEEFQSGSNDEYQEYAETIEARYSGLENILLYARIEFTQFDGELSRYEIADRHNGAGPTLSDRQTDTDTDKQKYTIGANWYPMAGVSISAQGYYKVSDTFYGTTYTGEDYPFLRQSNYETTDANIRLTWRAMPNLTLVSRYDYQQTTIESQGINVDLVNPILALIESGDINNHVFSQSVTWMPFSSAYVQGSFSYITSETNTPADVNNPAVTTDSDNDYMTASVTAGYAIDDRTDITASYSYYFADNYAVPLAANGAPAMGYGTSIEEHVFSASLNRRLTPSMLWNVGYAYYVGNDDTSGGFNDFSAHMVSTGLQIRF